MPVDGIDELIMRWLQGSATPEELEALREWRRASPERQQYCRELERTWQLTGTTRIEADRDAIPTAGVILARAARAKRRARLRQFRAVLPWAGVAAAITLVGFGVYRWRGPSRAIEAMGREFRTGPTELATVTLDDGTIVRLGPTSTMRVARDFATRIVHLDGRAYFSVTHRDGATFRVRTAAGDVEVTGTRFAVETDGRSMHALVLQGTVAAIAGAQRALVRAGQVGDVTPGAAPRVAAVPDAFGRIDAWVGDLVSFEATPLDEVAQELTRHYHVRVTLSTPKLAQRTVTASFTGWSLPGVLSSICAVADVKCTMGPAGVVISPQ